MTTDAAATLAVQVVVDAAHPGALSTFWATALGYRLDDPPPGFPDWVSALRASGLPEERWDDASAVVPATGTGPRIFFQKVPEGKQGKNRLHLDVRAGAGITDLDQRWSAVLAHEDRLIAVGASRLDERRGDWGEHWLVMTDPEGNEFCLM